MLFSLASLPVSFLLSGAGAPALAPHVARPALFMQTKKAGDVQFDNDMSKWRPEDAEDEARPGSKHTMSGGFESTDTPDFFPDEEDPNAPGFTDGLMGSQVQNADKDRSHNPGVEGALDVDPDIYVPEAEDLSAAARGVKFELPKSGMTDLDLEMFCAASAQGDVLVQVRPVAMTYEEYYCGFTSPDDPNFPSDPAFSCTPSAGKMENRKGPPTDVVVTCNPQGRAGKLVGYLCFVLPDEKAFSTFYQITCDSQ